MTIDIGFLANKIAPYLPSVMTGIEESTESEFLKSVDFLEQIKALQESTISEKGADLGEGIAAQAGSAIAEQMRPVTATATQMMAGAALGTAGGALGRVGQFAGGGAIIGGFTFPQSLEYAEKELSLTGWKANTFALTSTLFQAAIENMQIKGLAPTTSKALAGPTILKRFGVERRQLRMPPMFGLGLDIPDLDVGTLATELRS